MCQTVWEELGFPMVPDIVELTGYGGAQAINRNWKMCPVLGT